MLLYTVVSCEEIFPPQEKMETETRRVSGGYVELIKSPEGPRVLRIDSTDPAMYLRYPAPGDVFGGGR
jgi:hypothetical protein